MTRQDYIDAIMRLLEKADFRKTAACVDIRKPPDQLTYRIL